MILAGLMGSVAAASGAAPTPTYTFTPQTVSADEGSGFTFEIGGTNIVNGTYYWTIETGSSEFTTTSGSFTITNNYGVITVTPTADTTTEGSETFTVAIRSVSTSGTILETSSAITINDTSFGLGQYTFNGTLTDWAETNATVATYNAYTYPDETSGSLHTLTGTQYVRSQGFSGSATVCFNLWFYPTANNKIIIGELGQADVYGQFHYSVLEIDSTNHLKGRVWQMGGVFTEPEVTSIGTVTLNAWNHVYLYFNNATTTCGMSLNNEAAVTQGSVTRNLPEFAYWGIGLTDAQNMGSSARYQGKFDGLVISTTLTGSNYTGTKAKYLPSFSLAFGGDASPDYLSVPASADWSLGTSWTIEWWSKASTATIDGGAGLWTVMCQNTTGGSIDIYYQDSKLKINNGTVLATEPVPGQWTHVALINNAGTTTLYYNGTSVYSGGNWNLNNTTDPLVIGRRGSGNYQYFPGQLAMIRISNAAKYSATFTPTVTYGVEADTKLFLNSVTPLTDASASAHTITNNGTTVSGTFVNRYTALHSAGNQSSSNIVIDTNLNNDAWAGSVPAGTTVISQITGRFTVTSTGREIGTNNWVFYIGGSNNFTAGETHTFIW